MYTLLNAINTVKHIDTSLNRLRIFEDIAKKNLLIRLAFNIYKSVDHTPVASILLLLYGLKCFMSIKLPVQKKIALLCFASYPNEHAAINRIKSAFSTIENDELLIARKYVFSPKNWLVALRYIYFIPRIYRFAKKCTDSLHFMPACRVFSTLAFYLRYKQIFEEIETKGILIANHYSPECTALVAAALTDSIKIVYINHAHTPEKVESVTLPPVDLALLTSDAVLKKLIAEEKRPINYNLIGYHQIKERLKLDLVGNTKLTVGIFLTALTNKDRVRELVAIWHKFLPSGHILIRPHPVELLKDNFSGLLQDYSMVEISENTSLSNDIAKCDLVVCGNTSAVIEILKGGCPVIYDGRLDQITYDYNGFVDKGLVLAVDTINEQTLSKVSCFYNRPLWEKVMQFYDASYLNDEKKLLRDAEKKLKQVLKIDSVC